MTFVSECKYIGWEVSLLEQFIQGGASQSRNLSKSLFIVIKAGQIWKESSIQKGDIHYFSGKNLYYNKSA